jgi:glycosyltransferase involved in cell wall biosynthesis
MRIGIDGSFLARDARGMGRCIRSLLDCWHKNEQHRFVLLAYAKRHIKTLTAYARDGWEVDWSGSDQELDVCWFPWNRIDWDPGCPKVAFIHDVAPFTQHHPDNRHREQDQTRMADAVQEAERIMTNSSFSRIEIHRHLGVALEDIDVVHLAYDEKTFFPKSNSTVVLPKGLERAKFLLFVGNVEPRKNLHGLLEAFSLFRRDAGLPLVLVCPKPASTWSDRLRGYQSELEVLAGKCGSQLIWLDSVTDDVLVELYRQTRLFLMPSLYEGFGLPLLEAMACGAPLAAAHASSLPEVGGQVPAWFNPLDPVDMAKTITEALERPQPDPELGLEQARKFSWQTAADAALTVLEDTTRRPTRQASGRFSAMRAALAALETPHP